MLAAVMLVAIGTLGFGGIAAARVDGSTASTPPSDRAVKCADALNRLTAAINELTAEITDLERPYDPQSHREATIHVQTLKRAQVKLAKVQAKFDLVIGPCGAL